MEYTEGRPTSASTWTRIDVEGDIPKATIDHLAPATTHYIKVAPKFGTEIGLFSNPPEYITTPSFGSGERLPKKSAYWLNILTVNH